jgi:carboxypeptidase Taq
MNQNLEAFKSLLAEISDLSGISSILSWDKETQMPRGGIETRAVQGATLARIIHQKGTAPALKELLSELEPEFASQESFEGALVRQVRRDFERKSKLPTEFVAEFSQARARSSNAWQEARSKNDFKTFLPHLEKMFEMASKAANYYDSSLHPFDALLWDYDPGLKTEDIRSIFADLRLETVPLVKAIAAKGDVADYSILKRHFDIDKQKAFALEVSQAFGYDLNRGRLDPTAHPFAINFSRDDVRMTTRYDPNYLPMAMFGTFHEAGHAMYEQNTGEHLRRTPLARGCWSTVHESQSRLWENLVGRSRAFWQHWFPKLQAYFPESLHDVDAQMMYKLVNRVQPSLIRVEADEITYNLHIMLRFELELAVFEGKLKVSELPEAWNAKMQDYLGIRPPNDSSGVMQDVHWSEALFAYFPTYSLGNILSVQLLETAKENLGDLNGMFAAGQYAPLLGWLTEHVHQHGKTYLPPELIARATGKALTAKPYLAYLKNKFSDLYEL